MLRDLLPDGVIDAWIAPYPDCPDEDDPEVASFAVTYSDLC